jgi:hypothetical protein
MPDRPSTYRRSRLPKPDSQGRWRALVGRNLDGKPARFQVGSRQTTSEADALKRLQAIVDLYDRQCHELKLECWAGWVQSWAHKLSQAVPIVVYASPAAKAIGGQAWEELMLVRQLQNWGVPIVVQEELPALGYAALRHQIDKEVGHAVQTAMDDIRKRFGSDLIDDVQQATSMTGDPSKAPTGTLHAAVKNYRKHLEKTGKRDPYGNLGQHVRKCLQYLETIAEHHADCQLWSLDYNAIASVYSYWCNRPKTKRGNRCSRRHAQLVMQEIHRLLHWIDKQPQYRWALPKGTDDLPRKPVILQEDDTNHATAFRSVAKKTYTPEQLAVIVREADPLGRAIVGVCVNCAWGASEVGQWRTADFHLFAKHPNAAALGITSDDTDSWIVGRRPKTGIYGEHLLWMEVVQAVQPFLDGRGVLPVTSSGKPWYRPHSMNAQTQFANWWTSHLSEITKKHDGLPKLPFGSLRDLFPNILRREYSDEVASLALQHGKLSSDDLLNCYANLPFRKLFEATRELRTMFKPFLDALIA